jgi:hypothetical protein
VANSRPVWHDIFRKVTLKPDNIILEAETYEDTLNIVRGPGVNWGDDTNTSSDTFEINVDYNLSVPESTTKIRLEDVNLNYTDVDLIAGTGVTITRTGTNTLEFQAFGTTETDTLQTVTTRGNVTDKDLYMNNLIVGKIVSSALNDGFSTATSTGPSLTGVGTLDSPVKFVSTPQTDNDATKNVVINLSVANSGSLIYSCNLSSTGSITNATISLERQDPITLVWEFLENESGSGTSPSLIFQNIYSEIYAGSVNYRVTIDWTGNAATVSYSINFVYETGGLIEQPLIQTDSDVKTVLINDLLFFQNNIRSINSNSDIVFQPAGSGRVVLTNPYIGDDSLTEYVQDIVGQLAGGESITISYNDGSGVTTIAANIATTVSRGVASFDTNNFTVTSGAVSTKSITLGSSTLSLGSTTTLIDGLTSLTVDNININGNTISSVDTNGDINLIPNGTGKVVSGGAVTINTNTDLNSEAITVATITPTQIASFAVAAFRSGKILVQAYNSVTGEVQNSELLIVHNGTTAYATEYGVIYTGSNPIAAFNVDINSGNVRILATGATANSTQYKVFKTLMIA